MNETQVYLFINYILNDTDLLFRKSDGIMVGQRKGCVVVFGEEPNRKSSRVFKDEIYASRWLCKQAIEKDLECLKLAADTPWTLETLEEGSIIAPAGVMELPGGIRGLN